MSLFFSRRKSRILQLVFCCLVFLSSQSQSATTVTGEIGFSGELYRLSAGEDRRPGNSGRLFFRPRINFLNTFSIDLDLSLSSEGSSARQDINQIDVNPKWSWGEAHFGDFAQTLSPLSLEGTQIRGAGLNIHSNKFHLTAVSGLIKRAVSSQDSYRSYERRLTGVKLGIGNQKSSFFNIIATSSRDDIASLADIAVDTSATVGSAFNPASVTPQENLIVALQTKLSLFQKKFSWYNEFAASAFTRDRRSSEIASDDIPAIVEDVFTPRVSSSADFAYHTKLSYRTKKIKTNADFKFIGPGYVAHGVASQKNDLQELIVGTSYRIRPGVIKLSYMHQSDNLINQKSYTTDRERIGANVSARLSRSWSSLMSASYLTMKNDAVGTSLTDYHNLTLSANQVLSPNSKALSKISLSYLFVQSDDENPLRGSSDLTSHTIKLVSAHKLRPNLTIGPKVSVIRSLRSSLGGWSSTQAYGISAKHSGLNKKIKSAAEITLADNDRSNTIQATLKSNYSINRDFNFRMELSVKNFQTKEQGKSDFTETTARLSASRSF